MFIYSEGEIEMKKAYILLTICLAFFPLSVFAIGTRSADIVIESGIELMALQDPC